VLELKNVPTELILYATTQWNYCGKYVIKGTGKNTNPFLQGIAVWLILKAETPSGKIQNYWSQLDELALKCKLKPATIAKRISWLKREGLLQVENRKHLVLSSYNVLRKYNINIRKREETIYYNPAEKADLASVLVTIMLAKNKETRMATYWKKLTKNPDAFAVLKEHLIIHGADRSRMDDAQYFRQRHLDLLIKSYKDAKTGQSSYQLLHEMIDANPDLNCKAATYGRQMGYSVFEKENPVNGKDESESMGFSHLKQRLVKKGLIHVTKEHIESDYRGRKDEKTYHHRYVRESKKTIWYRPDQVLINYSLFYAETKAA
jgi:hypothetical protein